MYSNILIEKIFHTRNAEVPVSDLLIPLLAGFFLRMNLGQRSVRVEIEWTYGNGDENEEKITMLIMFN